MPNNSDALLEHLIEFGTAEYYKEHSRIYDEMNSGGMAGAAAWNEASAESMIKVIAAMIAENNTALLHQLNTEKDED
jgi:hypothetical protein